MKRLLLLAFGLIALAFPADAARNGSGTMSVPFPSFTSGTTISSSQMNSNFSSIVNEITNSIPRDGQAAPTANLPMGGFKLTGLPAGTLATDSVHLGQVQAQAYAWCGTAGGTNNALTLTPSPAITAYAAGQTFRFKTGSSQSDNSVTIAISGLSAKTAQSNGAAFSASIFLEASKWYEALYDGTNFQVSKLFTPDGVYLSTSGAAAAYQPLNSTLTNIAALSGLTDNRLLRTDSTVGLYQQSGIMVDDSNNVSGVGTFASGNITATGSGIFTTGIRGVAGTSDAPAGKIGEVFHCGGSGVSLTSTTPANICNTGAITAGDYDLWGSVCFNSAATTTISKLQAGASATSATLPASPLFSQLQLTFAASSVQCIDIPYQRVTTASTPTWYLVVAATFGTSTMTGEGQLFLRRSANAQ